MSKRIRFVVIISFIILISVIAIGIFYFRKNNKIVSVLTIDINPSLELSLNYKNRVIRAKGLNNDGRELLKDSKIKGVSLEKAVEEIAKSVIEMNYVTEQDNYVLISVAGDNIEDEVVSLMDAEFKKNNKDCKILKQEINESSKNNAEKYGISESKASYIESIIKENSDLTFEDLKDKTISEINKILESNEDETVENKEDKQDENVKDENENKVNQNSSNNTGSSNKVTTTKPVVKPVTTPPASNDRTGAWCEFYKTIPPEGGVDYETPGYISDTAVYVEEAKKHMPSDASWSSYFSSITEYRTASYCSAGVVELENYDKNKTYTMYLDSVTLEVLELITTDIVKPNIDEAGARPIIANWLMSTYGVNIDDCDWENYYYNIDGSTKIPEWQYTCKIEETKTYYAVTVVATDGTTKTGYTWTT